MSDLIALLAAVDALSAPEHVTVVQPRYRTLTDDQGRPRVNDDGAVIREETGTTRTRIEHAPLLDQMDAAVRGELNTVEGGGESLKFTRGMLDSDALFQLMRISSAIRDWAHAADAPKRHTLSGQLRAWYVAYTETEQPDSAIRFRVRILTGWANLIREKIDPHDEYIQPEPCPNPECPQGFDEVTGRPTWFDQKTREQYTDPLVITFRRSDGADMVNNARARCRACGTTWSVRALAYELEQAAVKQETGEQPAPIHQFGSQA